MSRNWIALIMVSALAVCATACSESKEAAEGAGAALKETAGEVTKMADTAVEATEAAAGDLVEQAQEAAKSLEGEAKAAYDKAAAELSSKQEELKALKQKLAEMDAKDMLSGKGKELKAKAETLTSEIGTLKTKVEGLINPS